MLVVLKLYFVKYVKKKNSEPVRSSASSMQIGSLEKKHTKQNNNKKNNLSPKLKSLLILVIQYLIGQVK